MLTRIGISLTIAVLLMFGGCAKRIPLSSDEVVKGNQVTVKVKSGESLEGCVESWDDSTLTLLLRGEERRILTGREILEIRGTPPVHDEARRPISEQEIESNQSNKNLFLFAVGGGGLSFGISFFTGSLLHRSLSDNKELALWATTGVGTILGTTMFALQGAHRDRNQAIERIKKSRELRDATQLEQEKKRRTELQQELEKLKKERQEQETKIQELKEQADKKKPERP